MCRWIAYAGPEIYLEDLLFNQENSIVRQSLAARESIFTTNGDGFGVAWYGRRTAPGLFKDILPAWNDSNLRSLASQIQTRRFFAHVRATTGTSVTRTNCHPFTWRNWAFMHNGQIGNWGLCRKDVEGSIAAEFYPQRQGTTDSEALFLLALSHGLADDPIGGIKRAIRQVLDTMERCSAIEPFRASIALTDGRSVWAFRVSSDGRAPSLYFGTPSTRAIEEGVNPVNTIASEPLDSNSENWIPVDESTVLHWTDEGLVQSRFLL
jgi:predicted glutamine amidotransferase